MVSLSYASKDTQCRRYSWPIYNELFGLLQNLCSQFQSPENSKGALFILGTLNLQKRSDKFQAKENSKRNTQKKVSPPPPRYQIDFTRKIALEKAIDS